MKDVEPPPWHPVSRVVRTACNGAVFSAGLSNGRQMWKFLTDLFRDARRQQTVLIFDEDGSSQPRRHQVRPLDLVLLALPLVVVAGIFSTLLVAFSPLKNVVPGLDSQEMMRDVRLNVLRLQAMQDSLQAQQQYLSHLRQLVIGQVDSASMASQTNGIDMGTSVDTDVLSVASEGASDDWVDHEQPALSYWRFSPLPADNVARTVASAERSLASLQLPVLPPVSGFMTRGFDARNGHFGVDFAVEEGSIVRSVGDGYVVFADWTHEGGYAIAVQHADGYLSVYKHNQRLLKRTGERVRARESVAVSGNTGESTTGPHLHVEFWQNGLAQDPRFYFVGE